MKSEKWGGMFVDLIPGDKFVEGSGIQCHVENDEPKVNMYFVCTTV